MGDPVPFRKKPGWQQRTRWSGAAKAFSYVGFFALAAVVAVAIHISGFWQDVIMPELSRIAHNNFAEEKVGKRTIRYATGAAYNAQSTGTRCARTARTFASSASTPPNSTRPAVTRAADNGRAGARPMRS